jgi:uncharacterized repeat protein (TIGR01451 family)
MAARRLASLLLLVAIGGFLDAAGARGEHVPGATYTGTHSGGGTVTFTVQPDGNSIMSFDFTYLPVGCGISLSGHTTAGPPVVDDTFLRPVVGNDYITYSGTFTSPQHATGTLRWGGPQGFYCGEPSPAVTFEATTSAPLLADLSVTMSDDPDPALVGDDVSYVATVQNAGPLSAPDATLTATLPPGVSFVAAESSQGGCSRSDAVVTCSLGAVAVGGSAKVTVDVIVTRAGEPTISATVSGPRQDPSQANNSTTQQTTVQAPCVVPNVRGKLLPAARQAIARSHCSTGKITRKYSRKVRKGRVVSQAPEPGARLPNGDPVSLVVSRGPRPR